MSHTKEEEEIETFKEFEEVFYEMYSEMEKSCPSRSKIKELRERMNKIEL